MIYTLFHKLCKFTREDSKRLTIECPKGLWKVTHIRNIAETQAYNYFYECYHDNEYDDLQINVTSAEHKKIVEEIAKDELKGYDLLRRLRDFGL